MCGNKVQLSCPATTHYRVIAVAVGQNLVDKDRLKWIDIDRMKEHLRPAYELGYDNF